MPGKLIRLAAVRRHPCMGGEPRTRLRGVMRRSGDRRVAAAYRAVVVDLDQFRSGQSVARSVRSGDTPVPPTPAAPTRG